LLLNVPVDALSADVNISTLENGMYIVSVQFESMAISNSVFIKQ